MSSLPGTQPTLLGLPDDVLCEIYKALEKVDAPHGARNLPHLLARRSMLLLDHEDGIGTGPSIGWLRLVHVCRRLRNIALYYLPELWGRLACVFPHAHAWETIIARSRHADLDLDLSDEGLQAVIPWPLPAHLLARTHSMRDIVNLKDPAKRKWWLGASLPRLKYLRLGLDIHALGRDILLVRSGAFDLGYLSVPSLVSCTIVSGFVSMHAPSLRDLAISIIDWTLLLKTLQTCPLLEKLALRDTTDSDDRVPVDAPISVSLPRLVRLTIRTPSNVSVCKFIDSLCFPLEAQVYFDHCTSPKVLRYLLLDRHSRRSQVSGDVLTLTKQRLFTSDFHLFQLTIRDYEKPGRNSDYRSYPARGSIATAREVRDSVTSDLGRLIQGVIPPPVAQDVRALVLVSGGDPGRLNLSAPGRMVDVTPLPSSIAELERLDDALRAFTGVAELYIQRESAPILARVLASMEKSQVVPSPALFPALEVVILDIFTSRLTEREWTVAVDILAHHKAAGRPLERLVLMGTQLCHLATDDDRGGKGLEVDLRRVEALVGEVVDEREGCTCKES